MNIKISLPILNQQNSQTQRSNKKTALNFKSNQEKDSFEMSIGYVNDIHGQTNNMMRILTGLKGDLKVSAGDNDIGDEKNQLVQSDNKIFKLSGNKCNSIR